MNDMNEIEQEFEKNVAELWKRDRELIKALEQKQSVMREALEFYADWEIYEVPLGDNSYRVLLDAGSTARKALKPGGHPMTETNRSHNPHSNADLKSEVERLKVELKEAQAAAAVMRNLLREGSELLNEVVAYGNCECDIPSGKTCIPCECAMLNKSVASTLSTTTAGTDFLARMAEAEELCRLATMLCNQAAVLASHCDALGPIDPNFDTSRAFIRTDIDLTRKAVSAFLKGEGVKA